MSNAQAQTSTSTEMVREIMTSPHELNKALGTNTGETEICELSERSFKLAVLKKLKDIQDNIQRDSEFYKINKKIEINFLKQAEILELKNATGIPKSTTESIDRKIIQAEEEIGEL